MNKLVRSLHPEIRIPDPDGDLVEFIASDESIDSYGEVIQQSGWQFNRFAKNAPVCDSHDYSSINNLIGQVVESRVAGRQLLQTVQLANKVPENVLAQKAFAMLKAKMLRACSVGFIPLKVARPSDGIDEWTKACAAVGMQGQEDSVNCIYQKQEMLELSLCVIGANANAISKAYGAGILTDADFDRWPDMRRSFESAQKPSTKTYSTVTTDDAFMKTFTNLISRSKTPDAPAEAEKARRTGSATDLHHAAARVRAEIGHRQRQSAAAAIETLVSDPETRLFLDGLVRGYCGGRLCAPQAELVRAWLTPSDTFLGKTFLGKSLTPLSGTLGSQLLTIPVSRDILNITSIYGAYSDLGVTPMSSMFTKFPKSIGVPKAVFLTPTGIGNVIPDDTQLTGSSLTPEANTIAIMLPVSQELLDDEKADLSIYLVNRFAQGLAAALDYASFQGNGVDDQTNGLQTGIWNDATIPTVVAEAGNTSLAELTRTDFLAAIAAVAPSALQRPCRFFIQSAFIAPLLALKDGDGPQYLLKTPAESGDGEWYLCGFPVTWVAQAPSAITPGSPVAVFGWGQSYMVALREELEVMASSNFQTGYFNTRRFRACARGFVQTRESTGLAKLTLAAN